MKRAQLLSQKIRVKVYRRVRWSVLSTLNWNQELQIRM